MNDLEPGSYILITAPMATNEGGLRNILTSGRYSTTRITVQAGQELRVDLAL